MVRVLLLTLITFSAFSQDIKFDNIGVSGGDFNNNNTRVSFTVGQPIIGTSANNSNIVTQGFQQGNTVFYNPSNPPVNPNLILGCTDSLALNYNFLANIDDGSCCGPSLPIPFGTQIGQDIDGEASGDQSGWSVSLSSDGNTIAIAAPYNNGNGTYSGHVRVYENINGTWTQIGQDIDGADPWSISGASISINDDGTILAIGAPQHNGYTGYVGIYEWNTHWNLITQIYGDGADYDFGFDLDLNSNGDILAVGSPRSDDGGNNSGKVSIYERQGNTNVWNQIGNDIDGLAANDNSGYSVSLSSDGNIVAIGAPGYEEGYTRIYEYNGSNWNQLGQDLIGESIYDYSGYCVSLSSDGNRVSIGAPENNGGGINSGHVRVHEYNGSTWNQLGQDINGEATVDRSGESVSMSNDGNTLAIGAHGNDGNGLGWGSGHARIYNWDGSSWTQLGFDLDGDAYGDYFGASVSLSANGNTVAIGAPNPPNMPVTSGTGFVRVFSVGGTQYTSSPCSGCTDSTAINYDPYSLIDDGSCIPFVYGCTDSTASNFNTLANTDDGSCTYCYAVADIGTDTVFACDSIVISTNSIPGGSYIWNSSNVSTPVTPSIGDFYQGGVVFWINPNDNTQGLVCDIVDLGSTNWGCEGTSINGADGINIGDGEQNTIDIVSQCTQLGIAAELCYNSTNNGYTDWFLPSIGELEIIYNNKSIIDQTSLSNGGDTLIDNVYYDSLGNWVSDYYASSSEWTSNWCYIWNFDNGVFQNGSKDGCLGCYHVRAARSFSTLSTSIIDTINSITVSTSGWNYVTVTDSLGCSATDSVYLQIDICGCTDPSAINYNSNATYDDGSCIATVYGCMDSTAFNFNPQANVDDGSCFATVLGCIDSIALNYDVFANSDDGSCIYSGCTDQLSWNYNPQASIDDGSCFEIPDCNTGQNLVEIQISFDSNIQPFCDNNDCLDLLVELNDGTQIIFPLDTIQEIIDYTICLPPSCTYELSFSGFINQPDLNIYNAFLIYNGLGGNFYYNSSYTLNTSCGCTDPTAYNYDSNANVDDGSCIEIIYGCTDSLALNFNALANTDDGSCILPIIGCMDSTMYNYNSNANISGPCEMYVYGCTNPIALNFDSSANTDDGTCQIEGCTDSTAFNFDPIANIDNGSCIDIILGCIDSTANNFDSSANTDDGSCYYCAITMNPITSLPSSLTSCNGFIYLVPVTATPPVNISWNNGQTGDFLPNLCDDAYTYTAIDANGCGLEETIILTNYIGCTDSTALNYDQTAIVDDGSCIETITGCTDSVAFNYNPLANVDDDSCIDVVFGCLDSLATNYNSQANTSDNSCTYCYVSADINNGLDTIVGCDSVIISSEIINNANYNWVNSNSPTTYVYEDPITNPIGSEWLYSNTVDLWPQTMNTDLLGNHGNQAGNYGSGPLNRLTLNNLPSHDSIRISFDLYIHDTWGDAISNPDMWNLDIAGGNNIFTNIISASFSNDNNFTQTYPQNYDSNNIVENPARFGAYQVGLPGLCIWNGGYETTMYKIDKTVSHNDLVFQMELYSFTNEDNCDESWSIDNVIIETIYSQSQSNELTVYNSGWNYLTVTDSLGCIATDSIYVDIRSCGCTNPLAFNYDPSATLDDGSCVDFAYGCTDSLAANFDSVANTYDGSCEYCDLQITNSQVLQLPLGSCGYMAIVTANSSYPYSTVWNNGTIGEINSGLCPGFAIVTITDDLGCIVTDTIEIGSVVYGCTDQSANNYDQTATVDDGSCTYPCLAPDGLNTYDVVHTRATFNFNSTGADYYKIRVKKNGGPWQVITQLGTATGTPGGSTKTKYFLEADASYEWQVRAWCIDGQVSGWSSSDLFTTLPNCPNAINHNASDIEAEWAVLNWDAPNNTIAGVERYLARVREQGTNGWAIVTPGNSGTDTYKLKGSLTPGSTYEFETRTWCNTGDINNPTDPYYKSEWGGSGLFTTIPCPIQTYNLYTSFVNANIRFFGADFIADQITPYDHFTIRYKKVTDNAWSFRSVTAAHIAAGGRNIGGLSYQEEYEWGIRTFCGVTSTWKSPWQAGPNFVHSNTARLNAPVDKLEVYPNPSRDIFNITFESPESQTIDIKIIDVVGEIVYQQEKKNFKGNYSQSINMNSNAKGVYFLQITTERGGIKKKIVLQ